MPGKNVVVCCDGTSNQFSAARTNVAKLCFTLKQEAGVQHVYYHPGVGTMEPPGTFTSIGIKLTKLLGLAIGYGLPADIRDAYVFLMNHYEPGDRVYIFGFSRGAYTARALASLLYMYGLLRKGNEPLVPYAIRMMAGVNNLPENSGRRRVSRRNREGAENIWQLANEFKNTFSIRCPVDFMGLWDTVNSVGWFSNPFHAPYTRTNPEILVGRHALAIDERRAFFQPDAWEPATPPGPTTGPKDVLQVWFPGSHGDVGGGYPTAECGLSKVALKWMICEAARHRLQFDAGRVREMLRSDKEGYAGPDPNGVLHNSLKGKWKLLEFAPKKTFDRATKTWRYRVNLFRRRKIPESAYVHEAAFERTGYTTSCSNFPKNAQMMRTVCDPALEN